MTRPTIVIALTNDYLAKAEPLFQSIALHAPYARVCVLVIVKDHPIKTVATAKHRTFEKGEIAFLPLSKLTSYKTNWPVNRPFYACAEGGEWLDSFHFADDEVIIHLDADFIMQRPFTADELTYFSEEVRQYVVYGNYHAYPPCSLREEFYKLIPELSIEKAKKKLFPGDWSKPMFSAGFVCMRAYTYKVLSNAYLRYIGDAQALFGHHAAGQWLMNWIVATRLGFVELSPAIHNAIWYQDTPCYERAGQLWYKDQPVLFNHTKFDTRWKS